MKNINISSKNYNFNIGNNQPLVFLAGPCAIESREHALMTATMLRDVFASKGIDFIYKSSFDKANRTSATGYRGVGVQEGLDILAEIRETLQIPVVTDIHLAEQAIIAKNYVDMIQIPAFLCRQTDLIQAAAATGLPVNIKKGQFLAPWDMVNVLNKALETGNNNIALCERGTTFGYGNLVVDMRGLNIMAQTGHPVIYDVTHSVQLPGGNGTSSNGQREFVPVLSRAGVATGIAALFMEVHDNPDNAPCDGPNMLAIKDLSPLLDKLVEIDKIIKG